MTTREFYTNERDEARLEALKWKEAHDKKAQELINLQGKFREYRTVVLVALQTLNEIT